MTLHPRLAAALVATSLGLACGPAAAVLAVGAKAPDFSTEAALGGETFRFALASALQKGPVVLYFFPKAFSAGCTVEAHEFAEATPTFNELGATVIGMSNDDIDTIRKFSVEACRNKFAVAADNGAKVLTQYDAAQAVRPDRAGRISYVISPQGTVLSVYASPDPLGHVQATMAAVREWKAASARP
jgi:peroxiredoxin